MAATTKPKRPREKISAIDEIASDRPYLIDAILPAHEIHLVGGPSGAGKTRWLMQLINSWQQGHSVFGFDSHPVPYVYVATDRSKASVYATCRDIGLDPESIPILPALDLESELSGGYSISWLMKLIDEHFPKAKLLIIEAIGTFVPQGKTNDYNEVSKFLRRLSRLCRKRKITIIGIHHTAKEKGKEKYDSPRDKLLGSGGGWSGFSETVFIISLTEPGNPRSIRRISVCPRVGSPDFDINFKFGDVGQIQYLTKEENAILTMSKKQRNLSAETALYDFFTALKEKKRIAFDLKDALAATSGLCSRSTLIRKIGEFCEEGVLNRDGHGNYRLIGNPHADAFEGTLL